MPCPSARWRSQPRRSSTERVTLSIEHWTAARACAHFVRLMQDWISAYLAAQKQAVDSIRPADVAAIVDTLRDAYRRDAQVFACGNGGNAANCSHFVTDFGKNSSEAM